MKRIFQYIQLCWLIGFLFLSHLQAQVDVINYSNKDEIYAIKFEYPYVWVGTSGGVVLRLAENGNQINNYTISDGLGSNRITSIAIDKNKTKWFGTIDNGVTSFDNITWKIHNLSTGNIDNHIFCVEADNKGGVWAGTINGAYYYDGTNWTKYNDAISINDQVRSISTRGDSTWFGTNSGLYLFERSASKWTHYTAQYSGFNIPNDITNILCKGDSMIIGTKVGISFFNHNTLSFEFSSNLGNVNILDIDTNSLGNIFIGTSNGAFQLYNTFWGNFGPIGEKNIAEIEFDTSSELWFGQQDFKLGLKRGNTSIPIVYTNNNPTIAGNNISSIKSNGSNIYIATKGQGFSIYNGTWTNYNNINTGNGLTNDRINDLAIDINGVIWLATDSTVTTYDGNIWSTLDSTNNGLISNKVNALVIDQNNVKWFGTRGGISKYDNPSWIDYTTADGLYENEVIAITIDNQNNIWFLHPNGLSFYNGTFRKFSKVDLGITAVFTLFDIKADKTTGMGVWIGTNGGVIHFIPDISTKLYTMVDGLSDNNVLSVHIDNQNIKYFGTGFNGISLFNGTNWQRIARKDTIASIRIAAIYADPITNKIWSGGNWGGLSEIFVPPIELYPVSNPGGVCPGASATLTANIRGGFGVPYSFQWSSAGNIISDQKTIIVTPTTSTYYDINAGDGFNSAFYNLYVIAFQTDSSQIFGPTQICGYSGVPIKYYVSTATQRTFNWIVQGGKFNSPANEPTVDVVWDKNAASRSLYLKEFDISTSCSVDQEVKINIDTVVASIRRKGENLILCTDSGLQYQWFLNEIPIAGSIKQFHYMDRNTGNVNGNYWVQITTPNQCQSISNIISVSQTMLKTFPVPSSDNLNIEFYSEKLSTGRLEIKNIGGKLIEVEEFDKQLEFQQIKLNLNNYKPGIYNYTIYLDKEKIASGNFIKE